MVPTETLRLCHVGPLTCTVVALLSNGEEKHVLLVSQDRRRPFRFPSADRLSKKVVSDVYDPIDVALHAFNKDTRGIYEMDVVEDLLRTKSEVVTIDGAKPSITYFIELEYDDSLEEQFDKAIMHGSTTSVLKLFILDELPSNMFLPQWTPVLDRYRQTQKLEFNIPSAPPLPQFLERGEEIPNGMYLGVVNSFDGMIHVTGVK